MLLPIERTYMRFWARTSIGGFSSGRSHIGINTYIIIIPVIQTCWHLAPRSNLSNCVSEGRGMQKSQLIFHFFFKPTSVIRTPTTPNTPHPTAKEMGKENLHPILPPHPPYPHLQRTRMTWQTGIVYPCELFIWRPISPNFPNANRRKTNGLDDKYPRESPRPEHS